MDEGIDVADKEILVVQEACDIEWTDKQPNERLSAVRSLKVDTC
ncbi:hypothetical protein [Slackia sp.]|nr:hypothetical protein [Slackia sp.]